MNPCRYGHLDDAADGVRRIHVAEALSYRRILLGGDIGAR